jgi:hypothetical protein
MLKFNVQVHEGGSTWSSSSNDITVRKGELGELGPISTKLISIGLQGPTRMVLLVPQFVVTHPHFTHGMEITHIHFIPTKDRKMWCNELHIVAKHNISRAKEC